MYKLILCAALLVLASAAPKAKPGYYGGHYLSSYGAPVVAVAPVAPVAAVHPVASYAVAPVARVASFAPVATFGHPVAAVAHPVVYSGHNYGGYY